jgi:hypothetical protein
MKKTIGLLLLWCSSLFGIAQQTISGTVYADDDQNKTTLPGAHVRWSNSKLGTTTDADGKFSLALQDSLPQQLIISYTGYTTDTLLVTSIAQTLEIVLQANVVLDAFSVEARDGADFSMIKPINAQTITQNELKKAACCNLSESFESNASVDVVYGDAVSGARAIQMLGLSGVYTQMLTENTPLTRGLSASYGLSYFPGTWLESIQITKGTGSVVNGYESMSGQINVEFLKPEAKKTERWFLNVYQNNLGRSEINTHFNYKFNDRVSTLLLAHGNKYWLKNDQNQDGFLDNPLSQQLNLLNRWKIQGKKTEQVFMLHGVYDDKTGGQSSYDPNIHRGTTTFYGIGIRTKMLEGVFKNGFLFPNSSTRSMGFIAGGKYHDHDTYFGLRNYHATQKTAYANLIFQDVIVNSFHGIKTGLSFMYDHFRENYRDTSFLVEEIVPGAFAEYTFKHMEILDVLLGLRADYHNLYGMQYTPRVHVRYALDEKTTLRGSAGTGFRTPHVIIENMGTLASNRSVYFQQSLLPERSFNTGGSITRIFKFRKREANVHVDYYYTYFMNQVVVDMDFDPHILLFYNLNGKSYSHSFQVETEIEPLKNLTLRAAWKHYEVYSTYSGKLLSKPMVSPDRLMFNISYKTPSRKWKFDLISNYFSESRMPNMNGMPADMRMNEVSDPYLILHFQITKLFRKFEWYLGGENLLNFVQQQAILGYDDPFGGHFDASMIWGPLNGRTIYTGIRYSIMK